MSGSQITDDKSRSAVREWIRQLHAELDRSSYYHLLQVGEDAHEPKIRDHYYKLVARLHPDLYVETLDHETRALLISVYSRLVEAYRVLSDGGKREQYDRALREGRLRATAKEERPRSATLPIVNELKNENAKKFFKLGQEALRQGNAKAAIQNLKFALSQEPDSAVLKNALDSAEKLAAGSGPVKG
jgi:DnaJ-class molecular chaperone